MGLGMAGNGYRNGVRKVGVGGMAVAEGVTLEVGVRVGMREGDCLGLLSRLSIGTNLVGKGAMISRMMSMRTSLKNPTKRSPQGTLYKTPTTRAP